LVVVNGKEIDQCPLVVFRLIVYEDDPYANDLMMMLLARDYRTHVVAELSNESRFGDIGLFRQIKARKEQVSMESGFFDLGIDSGGCTDVVILDTEFLGC